MADKTNTAYDLSLFETRHAAAVPNRKVPGIKPELVREKTLSRHEQREEARNRNRSIAKMCIISIVLVSLIGAVLQSRVEIVKNASNQAKREAVLAASISENVRLNTKLDSLVSLENVEKYAQKAGMKKIERYQIVYLDPLKCDSVVKYLGKPVR